MGTKRSGKGKPVVVTRADGTHIEYPSQSAAARGEKKDQATISKLCLGIKKSVCGMRAQFKDCKDVDPCKYNDAGISPVIDES